MLARSVSFQDGKGGGLYLGAGRVLTCQHVIEAIGSRDVRLELQGRTFAARVVYVEPRVDLAYLVFAETETLPAAETPVWVDRASLRAGMPVYLMGSPYGWNASLLAGIVSHTDRSRTDPAFAKIPFVQTQGLSYPGTSGAAVYLEDGRVAGINRATFGSRAGTGIGLVIPAGFVRVFLERARASLP